jgi:hypothetical protein
MSATPLATSASSAETSLAPAVAQTTRFKLILPRQALLLGVTALLQALATLWVLQPLRFLPYSGTVHSLLLPQVLCGLSLGLGALFAPFCVDRACSLGQSLLRALYVSVWTGVILLFGLLVASRLAPLEIAVITGAAALLAGFNFVFQLLALALPRAYSGIVVLWIIVLPCAAYFIAEIYLMQAGRQVWGDLNTPASHAARSLVHWLLNLSPGTLLLSLTGAGLVDGGEVQWLVPLILMGFITTACILVLAYGKGDRVKET